MTNIHSKLFLLILCGLFMQVEGFAQQDSIVPLDKAYKRVYNISKTAGYKINMDGRLNEDFWMKQGAWSDRFVQVMPYAQHISSSPTRVKLFYDNKYIYIGVYCKDAVPAKMNRFVGNRDDNSLGDLVSIAFDTYHDFRAAPEFNLNLGGNRTDLIVTDALSVNLSWNAVWEAKTHIDMADSSWTAEMRIPFSQLRYNQKSTDGIWGLHVRRIIRRNNEVQNWSLIPLKNNGHVFSFGEMHGMTDLPKSKEFEILPYVMGKFTKEPSIAGSPYQKGHKWGGDAGFDLKKAMGDFTLDLTVNPDFGQVELDPSVMNLTSLETFYDEKRPFFLEGKHILDFSLDDVNMFYTRRIGATPHYTPSVDQMNSFAETKDNVPIIEAVKLTGTNRRGVTIGVVQSITARSSAKITREGEEDKVVVEPLTSYTVARVQKNWKGNTLLGGMITSVNRNLEGQALRSMLVRNAFTGGIDFTQYFKNRLYYVDAKAAMSQLSGSREAIMNIQRNSVHYYQRVSSADYLGVKSDRNNLNGTGGYVRIGRKGNSKWIFSETFGWTSPGFDLNDIGYMKQADQYTNTTEAGFRKTDIWKSFRSNKLTLTQTNAWDYGGTPFSNDVKLKWESMLLNRLEWTLSEQYRWNYIDSRMLRGGPDMRYNNSFITSAAVNTDKAQRFVFKLSYTGNHNVDHRNKSNKISPVMMWRLGNHVYLSGQLDYAWNEDHSQYIGTVARNEQSSDDKVYLMGHIEQKTYGITLKAQVNITPDLSLQAYASPFTSIGKYDEFKEAADTKSRTDAKRYYEIAPSIIRQVDNRFEVNDGVKRDYTFANPDFSFNEFRSNVVARWEYLPGSTLYFVWEHTMSNRDRQYRSGWGSNLDRMFGLSATNTFMVKANYWFNL